MPAGSEVRETVPPELDGAPCPLGKNDFDAPGSLAAQTTVDLNGSLAKGNPATNKLQRSRLWRDHQATGPDRGRSNPQHIAGQQIARRRAPGMIKVHVRFDRFGPGLEGHCGPL